MTERLVIRLGSHAEQAISWLTWSDSEQEIIASGTLSNAAELASLSERASQGVVQILVPGTDVGLFSVELPATNRRQALKTIPFMLEDELAADIDLLHFVHLPADKKHTEQKVLVVEKAKLTQWSQWLTVANIHFKQMLPDWLALPIPGDDSLSILQLNDQVLIRQGAHRGATIAANWIKPWLGFSAQSEQGLVFESYGVEQSLLDEPVDWQTKGSLLPMQQLVQGIEQAKVNLLVGEFSVTEQVNTLQQSWRHIAIAAGIALVLIFVEKFYTINQLEQQKAQIQANSQAVYRTLNPSAKRVDRLKYRINQQLKELGSSQTQSPLFAMMAAVNQALAATKKVSPISVKFDRKRQEMRVQATADTYQDFEQLKQSLSTNFVVTTGAMNNDGSKVNGSLTIKVRS